MSRVLLMVAALTALAFGRAQASPPTPTPITWGDISAGADHTCGVRADQTLWCWGRNAHGQLGTGDRVDRSGPVQVQPGTRWFSVAAGHRHTCAIRVDDSLYCWGANDVGQLGIGTAASADRPTRVPGRWVSVATSYVHTCAVEHPDRGTPDGALWCWGWNDEGQLGTGDRVSTNVPRRVGTGLWWKVETGYAHTCAVDGTAHLYCWGRGDHGQLGLGESTDRPTPQAVGTTYENGLAVGADHTCAIGYVEPWTLRCWGRNHQGQLGVGTYMSSTVPAEVPAPAGERFVVVSTHDSHTCAWTEPSATLWCWGWNAFGQLGIGSTTGSPVPRRLGLRPRRVAAGIGHTCALRVDLTMWCWGKNAYGQLGLGDTVDRTTPAIIGPAPAPPPPPHA